MSKRPAKRVNTLEDAIKQQGALPVRQEAPTPAQYQYRSLSLDLDDIRTASLKERTNVARTIADLESWRAEIDATIAFLRGR